MRRQIPSTHALICFEASARTEHFGRAADLLNLSQSALSRQIQGLEEQVQHPLFIREKQRVRLTAAGRQLLQDLTPLLDSMEAAVLKVRSVEEVGGAVNIGVYPTLGSRWLMPQLIDIATRHPELTLNTITYLHNDEIDPTLVDIAIVQGDPPWPGYDSSLLMPERLVAVGSSSLVSEPFDDADDLLDQRILQHVTRPLSWPIWFESQGKRLSNRPTGPVFSQYEMLIDALKRGFGIAIVPEILIERELSTGQLVMAHRHRATPASAYYLLVPEAKQGLSRIQRVKGLLQPPGRSEY